MIQEREQAWSTGVQTLALPSGAPCGPTAECRLPADCWNDLYDLQLERARFEAGEALSTLRRLQRRVSELEEESRLQDAEISGASLQTELAHSLDSDQDQDQQVNECGDSQVSLQPTRPTFEYFMKEAGSTPFPGVTYITDQFL